MPFATATLTEWSDIHEFARHGWLYRGQRAADWKLMTSLEGCCVREGVSSLDRARIEQELFREFRRTYHHYAVHVPQSGVALEWLSLMQHHGAPTRLLDCTYSIYIASYFAVEDADADAAVWAFNGPWAGRQSASRFQSAGKPANIVDKLLEPFGEGDESIFEPLFFSSPHVRLTCPLNPFRLNERLRIQKGIFLVPGSVDDSFMANLEAMPDYEDEKHLIKIIIPSSLRRQVLQGLFEMNITRTSLFPGVDGFARSLGVYHPAFDPIDWSRSS